MDELAGYIGLRELAELVGLPSAGHAARLLDRLGLRSGDRPTPRVEAMGACSPPLERRFNGVPYTAYRWRPEIVVPLIRVMLDQRAVTGDLHPRRSGCEADQFSRRRELEMDGGNDEELREALHAWLTETIDRNVEEAPTEPGVYRLPCGRCVVDFWITPEGEERWLVPGDPTSYTRQTLVETRHGEHPWERLYTLAEAAETLRADDAEPRGRDS